MMGQGALHAAGVRLGRSHGAASDRIRMMSGTEGIERLEAHFHGQAFSPHRHDTYAIGQTYAGVQTFHFRGERWHCLPGQSHILHPDELHDGAAGTDAGFGYRIVYVDPSLIQAALGGQPLPFVAHPVFDAAQLPEGTQTLWDIDANFDDLARVELVLSVSSLLVRAASGRESRHRTLRLEGLLRVRDLLTSCPAERPSMEVLERLSGLDRWNLARQFRTAFGTCPSRFRIMRQLDDVRLRLRRGASLADAAIEAGFSDQSHMSRKFKSAYGMSPGRWVATLTCPPDVWPPRRRAKS